MENPKGVLITMCTLPKPQKIQPWMFGDNTEKGTLLWIHGLPDLIPDVTEKPEIKYIEWIDKKTGKKKRQTEWYYNTRCLSRKNRAKAASKKFPGIAKAMAEQWG